MKVDHICVGTREIQSTTSRWSWRRWHWQRPENHVPHRMNRIQMASDYKNSFKVPQLLFLTRQNLSNSYPNTATCAWLRMPYTAYGMLTPFLEYNEKTVRKSPKTRNYSTQSILNSPVIIEEVSVAPSGESFRNTFFFLRMFQSFSVGTCRTRQITLWALGLITTEHDMRPIRLRVHKCTQNVDVDQNEAHFLIGYHKCIV